MRFCDDHWARLREAIDERGLSHLVAEDGQTATANFNAEQRDGPSIQTFDPLLTAHNMIIINAMHIAADELITDDLANDGRVCPICFMNRMHSETCSGAPCVLDLMTGYDDWLRLAADDVKAAYQTLLTNARSDA